LLSPVFPGLPGGCARVVCSGLVEAMVWYPLFSNHYRYGAYSHPGNLPIVSR
jgi:hypothetical protein